MINSLYTHFNQLPVLSSQEIASQFQGRSISFLKQSINGDRLMELAKIVASLAVMILAVIVVGTVIYSLFSTESIGSDEKYDDFIFPPSPNMKLPKNNFFDFPPPEMPSFSTKKNKSVFPIPKKKTTKSDDPEDALAESAEKYLKQGDLKKALETIKKIYQNHEMKEAFIAKLAMEYFNNGDLKNAFSTIKIIIHDHATKEAFFPKLATEYFNNGDLKNALSTIKEIIHDHDTKENFLVKLAEEHFKQNNLIDARKTINEITQNESKKTKFLIKLLVAHHKNNNKEEVLNIIKDIFQNNLRTSIIQKYSFKFDFKKINQLSSKIKSYSPKLEQECYSKIEVALKNGNNNHISQLIKSGISNYRDDLDKFVTQNGLLK